MVCIGANKPGNVCARSSCHPGRRVATRAGGPPLRNPLPSLSAYIGARFCASAEKVVATATASLKCRPRNEVQPDFALDKNVAARAAAFRDGRPLPELAEPAAGQRPVVLPFNIEDA